MSSSTSSSTSRSISRRSVIGAGGALALAPVIVQATHAHAAATATVRTGPLHVLVQPVRVFDSRTAPPSSGGGRLSSGNSIGIPFGAAVDTVAPGDSPAAVWANITVTDTIGAGFLVVRPSDPTGLEPLPGTSNVNWSTNNQTLANLVLVAIGDETYIEVHAGGAGSTHVIVDLQGYIPIPMS
jgi:hypothetical protein